VYQDYEIPQLMRDLMKDDRKRCNYSYLDIRREYGADDKAVAEIVHDISDNIHVGERVDLAIFVMAMAPVKILLYREEYEKAQCDVDEKLRNIFHVFHRFGNDVKKSAAYQASGGKRHHDDYEFLEQVIVDNEGDGPNERDEAYDQACQKSVQQIHALPSLSMAIL